MNLRSDQRQNVQGELDFSSPPAGEAREARREETESTPAMHAPESPASTNRLMEEICERENLKQAWHPDGAGSIHPAGGDAGAAAAVGLDVLRPQLWFSTRAICTSSGSSSATVRCLRLRLGD